MTDVSGDLLEDLNDHIIPGIIRAAKGAIPRNKNRINRAQGGGNAPLAICHPPLGKRRRRKRRRRSGGTALTGNTAISAPPLSDLRSQ